MCVSRPHRPDPRSVAARLARFSSPPFRRSGRCGTIEADGRHLDLRPVSTRLLDASGGFPSRRPPPRSGVTAAASPVDRRARSCRSKGRRTPRSARNPARRAMARSRALIGRGRLRRVMAACGDQRIGVGNLQADMSPPRGARGLDLTGLRRRVEQRLGLRDLRKLRRKAGLGRSGHNSAGHGRRCRAIS